MADVLTIRDEFTASDKKRTRWFVFLYALFRDYFDRINISIGIMITNMTPTNWKV